MTRWTVRTANSEDADAIISVAAAAWRDTYLGLLRPTTIESFLECAYSSERVLERITVDHFYVAEDEHGIVAFADAIVGPDHVEIAAIYARPEFRGRGAGTALLHTLITLRPHLPISAHVLAGNRKGEVFYENRGFAAEQTMQADLFGESVVERRWWRHPGPKSL